MMMRYQLLILSAFVFCYAAVRAWLLPITHDEASTCFNHVPRLVVDTLMFQKEANPNNHILNTLAIKLMVGLFGWSQFVVRLPALFGGILYLWAANHLVYRISDNPGVRLFAFLLLVGNPYMLEFFALARGYGLAAGLMLAAIYHATVFAQQNERRAALWAALFAGLAVYANFTLLLFFAPFTLLWCLIAAQNNPSWRGFWEKTGPALKTTAVFIALWVTPLSRLSKDSEIVNWAEMPSFFITAKDLVRSATANNPYLGNDTYLKLSWLLVAGIAIAWIMALAHWRGHRWQLPRATGTWMAGLLAGAFVANIAQVWFTSTPYLQARLSQFYYPLAALTLAWPAQWLWERFGRRAWLYMAPLMAFMLLNHARLLNLTMSHEWWYDRSTFMVLDYFKKLHEQEKPAQPYRVDVNWVMLNSFGFHLEKNYNGHKQYVQLFENWHPRRTPDANIGYEFYYADGPDEAQPLLNTFDVVYRTPGSGFLLLRRKR